MIARIVRYSTSASWWLVIALAACAPTREPAPPAAASAETPPAVTRRPLPGSVPAPGIGIPATPSAPAAPATMPAIVVPAGAIYVCVVGSGTATTQTAIEYVDKVDALCRKHPEMGPCQYERNACRRKGGRVFAADGAEITLATEAEYDRKVRRVQFKAN
jgi:hypothetical protein